MPESECPYPKLSALLRYLDGLDGRMDLKIVEDMLRDVDVGREDITDCCRFGARAYKRNCIKRGEWYELVALCWRSGQCSPIHNHRGSSCGFKVIEGVGTEVRFEQTASGLVCPVQTTRMEPGYCCCAADEDIHQILNCQAEGEDLITLHLYSPRLSRICTFDYASPTDTDCQESGAADIYAGMSGRD